MKRWQPRAKVITEDHGDICIARYKGNPDDSNSHKLIVGTIEDGIQRGCRFFILEMPQVTAIYDRLVPSWVKASTELVRLNGKLAFLNPSQKLEEFLRLTQLHKVFPIYKDQEEALRRIKEDRFYKAKRTEATDNEDGHDGNRSSE